MSAGCSTRCARRGCSLLKGWPLTARSSTTWLRRARVVVPRYPCSSTMAGSRAWSSPAIESCSWAWKPRNGSTREWCSTGLRQGRRRARKWSARRARSERESGGNAMTADKATQPRDDSYDVVVIGSGLGGVSAAALLAKHGQKVLLAERGDAPGGYAHAFKREKDGRKYLFDAAIHVIPEGEFTEGLLDYLGVKDRATLVECDSLYGLVFPDFRLNVPMGREEFVATHIERFPHEAQAIRDFFGMLTKIFYEASALPFQISMTDMGRAEAEFP